MCTQGQVSYGRARNATRGHREGKGMAKHRPGCSASFMPDGKIRTAISRAKRANMQDPHWKGRAKRARRAEAREACFAATKPLPRVNTKTLSHKNVVSLLKIIFGSTLGHNYVVLWHWLALSAGAGAGYG